MQSNMGNSKILLGLTTTPGSDWKDKIEECRKFNITEVALFPTFLKLQERQELYELLKKSTIKSIPHVHLRSDMETWELDLFIKKYGTQVFNVHPLKSKYNFDYEKLSRYKDMIYLENQEHIPTDNEIKMFAGYCIDFTHWASDFIKGSITRKKSYRNFEEKIRKFGVGVGHVSAIRSFLGFLNYDSHMMHELKDLDYMKNYLDFLPPIISLELENTFEEQLDAKAYLEEIVNSKK